MTGDTIVIRGGRARARRTVRAAPAPQPRADAYPERFVLTAPLEITDLLLISGEPHLRRTLAEYVGRTAGLRMPVIRAPARARRRAAAGRRGGGRRGRRRA